MSNPYYDPNAFDDLFNDEDKPQSTSESFDYGTVDKSDAQLHVSVTGGGIIGGKYSKLISRCLLDPIAAALDVLVTACFSSNINDKYNHPSPLAMGVVLDKATGGDYSLIEKALVYTEWIARYHQCMELVHVRLMEVRGLQGLIVRLVSLGIMDDQVDDQPIINALREVENVSDIKLFSDKDLLDHFMKYSIKFVADIEEIIEGYGMIASSYTQEYVDICAQIGIKADETLIDQGIVSENDINQSSLMSPNVKLNSILQKVKQTHLGNTI